MSNTQATAEANAGSAPAAPSTATSATDAKAAHTTAEDSRQTTERAKAEWRVIGETVPGASHLRAGIPNQDAILHLRQSSVTLPVIVAVSDGHGSHKCFRSDRGSRFAVRIGTDLLDELVNEARERLSLSEIESRARDFLTAEFIRRWRADVEADLKREPLAEEEFARLVEKDGVNARRHVEANPYLAYGATALAFLLTPTYALYMQLGDGEMLTVSERGEVAQPLSEDARLLANETTSLCLENAAADFRVALHTHGDELPALILMTTDGYANSFSTTAGFHQVGGDLLAMLREKEGFDAVNRDLKGWLEEATQAGSGDDCTLAIICRMDALQAQRSPLETTAVSKTATSSPPQQQSASSRNSDSVPGVAPVASHEQPATPETV